MHADLVQQLLFEIRLRNIPEPAQEYRFAQHRRWRFDLAWVEQKIAIEVEGGIFVGGRHTHPVGFLNDMEKYNCAAMLGWRVLRWTPRLSSDAHEALLLFLESELKTE